MAEPLTARVRTGPPTPDSSSTWEVVVGEGQTASRLALRPSEAEAEAFADGWNLAFRSAPALMSVPEVASALGRSSSRTYALMEMGEVPSTRVGGRLVLPRQAFELWVADKSNEALASVAV